MMLKGDKAFAVLICLALLPFDADVRLFWAQPQVAAVRVKQKTKGEGSLLPFYTFWVPLSEGGPLSGIRWGGP